MNKRVCIAVIALFGFAIVAKATPTSQSLSPYEVVVPSLNGDPAANDRVSGQLYYDVTTGFFKGIDGSGAVKSFLNSTSSPWVTSGSDISYTGGGAVIIGGTSAPSLFKGLDVQVPTAGDALLLRIGSSGTSAALSIRPEHAAGVTNIQGTNSSGLAPTTVAINAQGGAVIINNGSQNTINGPVRMSSFGAGTCTFDSSGNISSSSDERLKTEIRPFETGLSALSKINPIRYKWNTISGMETKNEYVGFSAQNVQNALPEGVGYSNSGYLSLQERAIIATLVNSVKELEAEVKKLKSELKNK